MTPKEKQQLLLRIAAVENGVKKLYGASYSQVLQLEGVRKAIEVGEEDFSFAKHPDLEKQFALLMGKLDDSLIGLIAPSIRQELLNGRDNSILAIEKAIKGENLDADALSTLRGISTQVRRNEVLETYKKRKIEVSEAVWKNQEQSKREMEVVVQNAILQGRSAAETATDIKKYLDNPDALFRRVRNKETGNLELSKAAREYHPGAGVYRSAYKNALRLTRTEMNNAYREGEWASYQDNPLVKGFEIRLSNNHTTTMPNGAVVALTDICDTLAGFYPTWFKFRGWHPQCRCAMIPVTLTPKEFGEYHKAKSEGRLDEWKANQPIVDLPENFKWWITENSDSIEVANKLPFFLSDNGKWKDGEFKFFHDVPKVEKRETPIEVLRPESVLGELSLRARSLEKKADAYIHLGELLWGSDSAEVRHAKGDIAAFPGYQRMYEDIISRFKKQFVRTGTKQKYNALLHWEEMCKYSGDLSKVIPTEWISTFNGYVKNANSLINQLFKDVEVKNSIEGAYNIFKLATNAEAKSYGFDRISKNTPHQIFTEFPKYFGSKIIVPNKEFFDSFKTFVPLVTNDTKSGCFYDPKYKHVVMPINKLKTRQRFANSEYYRERIFYHEFGHAKADVPGFLNGKVVLNWEDDSRWVDFLKNYENIAINSFSWYDTKLSELVRKGNPAIGEHSDVKEMCGGLSDTIQALAGSTKFCDGYAHNGTYFKSQRLRISEIIAHASENKWMGNPIFKSYAPPLFRDLMAIYEDFMKITY